MTQEEKELLLKDLCARLPHAVICKKVNIDNKYAPDGVLGLDDFRNCNYNKNWLILPYLRPLSSMTDEEKMEWFQIRGKHCNMSGFNEIQERADFTSESLDWLNAHHFDYRGLIEKGLALEAPEDMYKFN